LQFGHFIRAINSLSTHDKYNYIRMSEYVAQKIFAKEVSKKYINGVGYVSKCRFRNT